MAGTICLAVKTAQLDRWGSGAVLPQLPPVIGRAFHPKVSIRIRPTASIGTARSTAPNLSDHCGFKVTNPTALSSGKHQYLL